MDDRLPCPSEATLRNFLIGNLSDDEGIRIAIHIEQCSECENALERLREADPAFVGMSLESRQPSADALAVTRTHFTDPALLDQLDRPENRFDYSVLASTDHRAAIGRLGKYDVIREMGHGGYGVVFEGWDEQLHRAVAMKVLNRELSSSAVARRRFLREARAAAAINHPNVVTIHAVEEHGGIPFLVMELVTGGSLRDRIRNGTKPTVFEVLRIGWQIATGLAAAHHQGVTHRDIKPANILLETGLERIKITDFGLARVTVENVDLTTREVAVGTPTYMAPEQVAGAPVDARSDLFSLGCVLYSMFVGHSPFHGRSALEVARKIADEDPPPLHVVDPAVPKFLSDIIQRLLAKSPDARFQSASELAEVLSHHLTILNQTPTDKLDAALRDAIYQPNKSRSAWRRTGIGGGVLTACCGVLALIWYFWLRNLDGDSLDGRPIDSSSQSKTADAEIPISQRKLLVTVAQSSSADCTTIADALRRVRAGGTIRVVDDGEYDESVIIDNAESWRGITIVADQGAVLTSSAGGTVVVVHDTPAVTLRGFHFKVPDRQHAIEVTGDCQGLLLEDLQAETTASRGDPNNMGFIYIHDGAAGTAEQPLTVRRVKLNQRRNSVVIGEQGRADPERPVRWLVLEDCAFIGPPNSAGYQCVIFGGVEHVTLQRCIFANGACGFSVAKGDERGLEWLREVTISDCTLYRLDRWLAWSLPVAACDRISFRNNLILQSDSADFSEASLVSSSWFIHNWWEVPDASPPPYVGLMAKTFDSIPLRSENPDNPDYLRPDLERMQYSLPPGAVTPGAAATSKPANQ